MGKLTVKQVETAPRGMHGDGNGLWLQVQGKTQRSWCLRYTPRGGKPRQMGLGPFPVLSLADARAKARELREIIRKGGDPLAERDRARTVASAPALMTFSKAAERYLADNRGAWKTAKYANQWLATLTTYAFPSLGAKEAGSITTADVKAVLDPIWTTKTEMANKLRGRIEAVLAYADTHEGRDRRKSGSMARPSVQPVRQEV